jgi:short subunit dehydrogenase-like uncharacterized protein
MPTANNTDNTFDIVVFGATSFVGQILCRHLVARHGTKGQLRWAIAGRNASKLKQVARDTGAEVECIIADASDKQALEALVARTRVVISTVGPYALYGSELVAACARAGTDYCDLTGEPQWMQKMIDTHSSAAAASGSRLVHTCGFDSIPSDLGVWYTQQQSMTKFEKPCVSISMRVKSMKGGASGGTIASMMNVIAEATKNPALRKMLSNPYALAPQHMRTGVKQPNVSAPRKDSVGGGWAAPFVMASVNTRVVLRSHALLGQPWGKSFLYDEATMMGTGAAGAAKASALSGGLVGFMAVAAVPPLRAALNRFVLPKPGEGPSAAAQSAGSFDIRFFGATGDGRTITTKVTGDRDPGYGSTAKMLGEAALCLAELSKTDLAGGFWTPSTAFGDVLIERLRDHAGLTFEDLPMP